MDISTVRAEPSFEPTFGTEPEFEPTIETEPEFEPTIETEPEFEPTVETEPEFEPTVETEPEIEPTPEIEPEFEPTAEAEYDPQPEVEIEPESGAEPDSEVEPEGESAVSEEEPNAFAEDGILSDTETIMWTCLYILLITTTLIINALIIRAMTKRLAGRRRSEGNCIKKPSDMFLLSLVVARMNVAGFVMPARIMGMFSTRGIGPVICKLCEFAGTGSATTSVLSTCAVGISKVVALHSKNDPSAKSVIIIIALLWILGHVYAVRQPFLVSIVTRENSDGQIMFICGEIAKHRGISAVFMICDIMLLFVVPTVIVIFASISFIRMSSKPQPMKDSDANEKANDMTANDDKLRTMDAKCVSKSDKEKSIEAGQAKRKLCRADSRFMAVIIMFLFIFCYAAAYAWKLLVFFDAISHLSMDTSLTIEQALFMWTFLNPVLNACVYLYFRADIRERFISIFVKEKEQEEDMQTVAENENTIFTKEINDNKNQCVGTIQPILALAPDVEFKTNDSSLTQVD